MLPQIRQIAEEFKEELQKLYGDDFAQLILFGSYARGDYHEESDVDFAVVLKNENFRPVAEILRTSKISTNLGLKYGVALSTFPIFSKKMKESSSGVYQEIRMGGIVI